MSADCKSTLTRSWLDLCDCCSYCSFSLFFAQKAESGNFHAPHGLECQCKNSEIAYSGAKVWRWPGNIDLGYSKFPIPMWKQFPAAAIVMKRTKTVTDQTVFKQIRGTIGVLAELSVAVKKQPPKASCGGLQGLQFPKIVYHRGKYRAGTQTTSGHRC